MTDRELLEKAAKAAGYEMQIVGSGGNAYGLWYPSTVFTPTWNPLTDDGDALRLAVKLGLSIHTDDFDHLSLPRMPGMAIAQHTSKDISEGCDWGDDPYAATRRAIVRAAAAIGEKT